MRIFMLFLFLSICVACNISGNETNDYRPTINIDTGVYKVLEKKFNVMRLWQAPDYLGGLDPTYPIAIAYMDCFVARDTDWRAGGIICGLSKIVIKKQNRYTLITNRAELKNTYAPITSKQEALSYAVLYTRFFAVFDISFFKSSYDYFGETPVISYAKPQNDGYLVHLFSYKQFGCGHPYYSTLVKVTKSGEVQILQQTASFEDPQQYGLCVD